MIKFAVKCLHASVCLLLLSAANAFAQTPSPAAHHREVAITFDDLPLTRMNPQTWRQITAKLLVHITAKNIPAIGFVNEGKLYEQGRLDTARVALLLMWLDAGLELGNHSFAHGDLHRMAPEKFKADILQGEKITKQLLAQQGRRPRYFRHPFLHTGTRLVVKNEVEEFLNRHQYAVAPVTVDNSEWIFARAYDLAAEHNDVAMQQRLGAAYVPYLERKFEYFEKQSRALFGYEIKQVLLVHANALNADYFGEVAKMLAQRAYVFIPLEAALRDQAYRSRDTYTGPGGLSWLARWALTQGKKGDFFEGEPRAPEFVLKAAGVDSE